MINSLSLDESDFGSLVNLVLIFIDTIIVDETKVEVKFNFSPFLIGYDDYYSKSVVFMKNIFVHNNRKKVSRNH